MCSINSIMKTLVSAAIAAVVCSVFGGGELPSGLDTEQLSFTSGDGWLFVETPNGDYVASASVGDYEFDVDSNYKPKAVTSKLTATVTGPAIVRFSFSFYGIGFFPSDHFEIVQKGSSKFRILVDGRETKSWTANYPGGSEIVDVPSGNHTIAWELSGTPQVVKYVSTEWYYDDDLDEWVPFEGEAYYAVESAGSVLVEDIKSAYGGQPGSVSEWLHRVREVGSWNVGDLARFADDYEKRFKANPKDYEARIMHAAVLLAKLAESKTVSDYAKKFGYTLNYFGMNCTDKESATSNWPAVNTIVDQFVKEAVPVIKTALSDLEAIPEGWTGSVTLSSDEFPVDEDTSIDIGDVLYARAGLEAAVGLAYFAQGYDLTVDYAKIKALSNYQRPVPVVQSAPSMTTDEGWEDALSNGDTKILVCSKDKKLYLRQAFEASLHEECAWENLEYFYLPFVNLKKSSALYSLSVEQDWETGDYTAYVYDAGKGQSERSVSVEVDEESGVWTFSVDLSKNTEMLGAETLGIDQGVANFEFEKYDEDYGTIFHGVEFDKRAAIAYKFLNEQTKLLSKVRTASALAESKTWIRKALARAIEADEAVVGRDDDAMHVIEYDMEADGESIDAARNLTAKALVALDEPAGVDVEADVFCCRVPPFDTTLLPVDGDGLVRVYLGALFSGKITRDMLPQFQKGADGGPVPVVETIPDPTLGGLFPDFTSFTWTDLARDMGQAVAHKPVTVKLDANGGKVKTTSLELAYDDYYEGCVYPELPVPDERRGYTFIGWAPAKDDIDGVFEWEGELFDSAVFGGAKTPTLYAQWLKSCTLTVAGGLIGGDGGTTSESGLFAGDELEVTVDESAQYDKNGNWINAFANWTYTPAGADLGEYFDKLEPDVTVTMPNADVKLTANYVKNFAAFVYMDFYTRGDADDGDFYWSVDNGKTLVPFGCEYPVAAGTVTVKFYDKSGLWRTPSDLKLTVSKRGTSKEGGITYYDEPDYIERNVTFIPVEGSAQVAFDANGGKSAVANAWILEGWEWGELPVPERSGYKFDGWWTAKTGGERIWESGLVDLSMLDARKPTVYAHWLKAYTLTLNGSDATAYYEDGDGASFEGSKISVLQGDYVEIFASESYTDKNGAEYVFQQWTAAKAADLGEEFDALSPETSLEMPAADVTLTATYVAEANVAEITADVFAEIPDLGGLEIEPPFDLFQWSVDGKNWYPVGATLKVDAGSNGKQKTFNVQWRSLSDAWTAPSGKTAVNLAAGDYEEITSKPFVFSPVAATTSITVEGGEWRESEVGGTATMNPKDGKLPFGKSLTFTAKANKNYAFVGWTLLPEWQDMEFESWILSPLASYKVGWLETSYMSEEDYKVHYAAVFRAVSDYSASDMETAFQGVLDYASGLIDVSYFGGAAHAEINAVVGCAVKYDVISGCSVKCMPLAFKTSGKLPAGLKFDAKTGILSGTPTASGASTFTVTATDPAGNKCNLNLEISVVPLSGEVAGEYRAMLNDPETGLPAGLLELSVTSAGKVSGKITKASGTVTLKPELYWIDRSDAESASSFEVRSDVYKGNDKSGSYEYLMAELGDGGLVVYEAGSWSAKGDTYEELESDGSMFHVDAAALADASFKSAFFGKYYTAVLTPEEGGGAEGYRTPEDLMAPGYVTLSVDAKGVAKVAGKMSDGVAVSASAALLPADDGARALLFCAPSNYKKAGFVALDLLIDFDGIVRSEGGAWVTPPVFTAPTDEFAEDESTLPALLQLSADGSEYSAFDKVKSYYLSLEVTDDPSGVWLPYTYTDANKQKVQDFAEANVDFGFLGSPLIKFADNKVTVEASPKIWKDSDGFYHYDETDEDRNGKTQEITNPAELSMKFTKATGVFDGKFNVYFDYETPKFDRYGNESSEMNHKAVSVPYAGVVVRDGDGAWGAGSGQYAAKYVLDYVDANKRAKSLNVSTTTAIGLTLDFNAE